MVIDKIENLRLYESLNPLFRHAFDYLEETNFNQLSLGRHSILGDDVFALFQEYNTKNAEDCLLENHRKYIDVQYVVQGREIMGMASFVNQKVSKPYHADNDISFYEGDYNPIKVEEGNFTIFFPDDLHMPSLKAGESSFVRKVVIKIRANS